MTLNDKPKPLAKTYAKWVEFTDAMAQQVPSDFFLKVGLH